MDYISSFLVMVVEFMSQESFCENCGCKNACQDVYGKLGRVQGPSILPDVVLVLLLPMVIFIVTLATAVNLLHGQFSSEGIKTAVSVLLASLAVFLQIVITARFFRNSSFGGLRGRRKI